MTATTTSTTSTTGPDLAALVRGALDLETTARGLLPHRLPAWVRAQCPDGQLLLAESQPSGVRVAFCTSATVVELETVPTKRVYAGTPRPDGRYDLVVDGRPAGHGSVGGGDVMTLDLMTGAADVVPGPAGRVGWTGLAAGPKDVEVWLPHDERTELVALHTDAAVAALPLHDRPVWVHHGSSISQGSNAAGPSTTWPAIAAAAGGVELVNLGLGGSALLDPFIGRVLRDAAADLLSLELGINVVNTDLMRRRAFGPAVHGILDTIRDAHPTTPVVLVSPVLCPIHEETPGPSAPDPAALAEGRLVFGAAGDPAEVAAGKLTLTVVRDELARVVAQRGDVHLHLVDGRELYGEQDHEALPLPDGLHPDAATHRLMGERFGRLAFDEGGAFAR